MTDVGHTGEAVAAKYYQQRGWLLLNHNYRTRLGELDLILYKENPACQTISSVKVSLRKFVTNIRVQISLQSIMIRVHQKLTSSTVSS